MKKESLHKGHRSRMRKRYMENGIDALNDHEILEILLYYAIPRSDTNELSHSLLDKYGTLANLFEAPFESLKELKGMGETSAMLIKLIPDICRIYYSEKKNCINIRPDKESLNEMVVSKFIGKNTEAVVLTLLDAKMKVLFCDYMNEGNVDTLILDIKKLVKTALQYNTRYAIIAHNHPSGVALPSKSDIESTYRIRDVFNGIDIKLIDHIIVADNDYVSLADDGMRDLF